MLDQPEPGQWLEYKGGALPFGLPPKVMIHQVEARYSWGSQAADYCETSLECNGRYTFTGQRSMVDGFGLMYYNARWYDPHLGRFAQADSMVPGAGNPMAWDRYAYVLNNPLRFIDPSGHICVEVGNKMYCSEDIDDESDDGRWLWWSHRTGHFFRVS